MSKVLDSVNKRTQLVGQNRLELLLFCLNGEQQYGINVFKVKEVLQCPSLTVMPNLNAVVKGIAHVRGGAVSVMDLSLATQQGPLDIELADGFVIMAEYNMTVQGFLVRSVERIVNTQWEDIHPPPKGVGNSNYLTAVTEIDGKLVEIIDVEKVLSEVVPANHDVSDAVVEEISAEASLEHGVNKKVMVVDDSAIARKQIKRCIESIGFEAVTFNDGRQALEHLRELAAEDRVYDEYLLMVSDIEMPEMDGYTLTAAVRDDVRLQNMHVILHTSLSGIFNEAMVKKVGADDFLAKFNPDLLAERVQACLQAAIAKKS